MRIETSGKPKSYLNPKDQRRLLALVGVLILVLVASRMAANPANWQWMFGGQSAKTEEQTSKKDTRKPDQPQSESTKPLKPGEFRATRSDENSKTPAKPTTAGENAGKQNPGTDGQPAVTTFGPGPQIDSASVEIHSSILKDVEDRSWNIRPQESGAYLSILKHVDIVSQRDLQRVGRDNVALTVLMSSSQEYRGSIVTIDGELYLIRKLPDEIPAEAGDSNSRATPLYDAWIRPYGSDKTPYRVVFSELPHGMDTVDDNNEFKPPLPVRVTGYFFKVQKYEIDAESDGFAPLILAKRLRVLKSPATSHRSLAAAPYIVGFICFVLAALALAIWRFSVGDKAFHQKHLERITEPSVEEKVALNDLPAADPVDLFAHLAEADREGAEEANRNG